MAARQPSASFADRDASRSHESMMTERDEGTDGQRLAQVWNIKGPVSPGGSFSTPSRSVTSRACASDRHIWDTPLGLVVVVVVRVGLGGVF